MTNSHTPRTGAQLLVDALAIHGVDRVFCVPGESYLAVLDALNDHPEIQTVSCRQEGGAAMMAEADGKLTGRPGICMVTRGPGATNASAGVHVAFQDSTPLILFVGQVGRDFVEREAFQEIDYRRMFGQMAKWVAQIDHADRVPEFVARGFSVACSGRPGPVVLALPEDMLVDKTSVHDVRPMATPEIFPSEKQMQAVAETLRSAAKPLLILGGSRWDEDSCGAIRQFAEAFDLPVVASFRRQDLFDNENACYIGEIGIGVNPKLRQRVLDSDLLLVIGARLGEMATSGYRLVESPMPRQRMVHIHASAEELGRVYQAQIAINATPQGFASMLPRVANTLGGIRWTAWRDTGRQDYEKWQTPPVVLPGAIQLGDIIRKLRAALPADAIVTNGAGNFTAWVHRFHRYRSLGTQLAPVSGSMGYGLPAAIAGKLRHPGRSVVCVAGDGDFLMTGQELATAAQLDVKIVIVIVDNGMYGTIRMHQERNFPGRPIATHLKNPDFVTLAKAYGLHAERIEKTNEFEAALNRAVAADTAALIHLVVDPEALTPGQTLSQIRATASAAKA